MADGPARIRRLSSGTQTLVASRLQILSLDDVVLELVKNSLDAKATNVEVRLDLKKGFCVVLDNGCGILAEEFLETGGLAKLYNTSKIGDQRSYGRNGCFLASLAGLAIVSISSCHAHSDIAYWITLQDGIRVAGGKTTDLPTTYGAGKQGTKVTVHDLFGRMPVRARYNRHRYESGPDLERDFQSLKLKLVALLLSSPHAFSFDLVEESLKQRLRHKSRHSHRLNNLLSRTTSILSQLNLGYPIDGSTWRTASIKTTDLDISAVFNLKPLPTRSLQFISIGQCPVPSSGTVMYNRINDVFDQSDFGRQSHATATKSKAVDRWPTFHLRIDIDTHVDSTSDNFVTVASEALGDLALEFLHAHGFCITSRSRAETQKDQVTIHRPPQSSSFDAWARTKSAKSIRLTDLKSGLPFVGKTPGRLDAAATINLRTGMALPLQFSKAQHRPKADPSSNLSPTASVIQDKWSAAMTCEEEIPNFVYPGGIEGNVTKEDLRTARVIGQLDRKFILANTGDAVVIIDQHAADERIRLEEYLVQICVPARLVLSTPIQFELDTREVELCQRAQPYLSSWGFDFVVKHEADSNAMVCITALPEPIAERCRLQPPTLIHLLRTEIWATYEAGSSHRRRSCNPQRDWLTNVGHCPQGVLDTLVSQACRSAIMFNDILSHEQARNLMRRLAECVFPFQCAHGRPSMAVLTRFEEGRRWHGGPASFGEGWRAWEHTR